jgi:uncharacterized membrane protein
MWTTAGGLLVVKSALGMALAFVAFAASRNHHRRFLNYGLSRRHMGLGVVLVVFAAATLVLAIALFRRARWARLGTFVVEGIAVVIALSRIGSAPRAVVLSIVLSAAVVALVALGTAEVTPTDPAPGPAPPSDPSAP